MTDATGCETSPKPHRAAQPWPVPFVSAEFHKDPLGLAAPAYLAPHTKYMHNVEHRFQKGTEKNSFTNFCDRVF